MHKSKGKKSLLVWANHVCIDCKRFINKMAHGNSRCPKCAEKNHLEYNRKRRQRLSEGRNFNGRY
jgi:hypothetical protein